MHSLLDVTPYLVIDRIKVAAIRRPQFWRNESGCWLLKKSHSVECPVCECAVSLTDEEIAWHVTRHRQQLLRQEHVTVIAAVDIHSRMDKDVVHEAKLWDASGHHNRSCASSRKFALWLSTGSAATQFRCGGTYYMGFVYNLLLFLKVKKSIKFWQSYHHQLGVPLFGIDVKTFKQK